MTNYRVNIYREMRTVFSVTADTQEAALKLALDMPLKDAEAVEDCEGIAHGFLVDTLQPDGSIDYDIEWAGSLKDDAPVEDNLDPADDKTVAYVTVDYDQDPDLSWYEGDKGLLVALEMTAYNEANTIVGSLSNITFYRSDAQWETGVYDRMQDIPEGYLRDVASNMGMKGEAK